MTQAIKDVFIRNNALVSAIRPVVTQPGPLDELGEPTTVSVLAAYWLYYVVTDIPSVPGFPDVAEMRANLLEAAPNTVRQTNEDLSALPVFRTIPPALLAQYQLKNEPGWKGWDADTAEQYVIDNVVDLASAKRLLRKMARVIIYLRDH